MEQEFTQKTIELKLNAPIGKIKVSKLLTILDNHPHKESIVKIMDINSIIDDVIVIENVDAAFQAIKQANEKFEKLNVIAETKNIDVNYSNTDDKPTLNFLFEECIVDDELKENLVAEAIYDSKNKFFKEYEMSKYANHLTKIGLTDLVKQNVLYFKNRATLIKSNNKSSSYRLLKNGDKHYLRGITTEKYNEYGIDFTFFVTIILLHLRMKQNSGDNYSIVYLSLSESKLDMIVKDNRNFSVQNFGDIKLAVKISTNELGNGSLNVVSTIRVEGENDSTLVYLFPKEKNQIQTKYLINHITGLSKVFSKLEEFKALFNISDQFVNDIKDIQGIKTPDELRLKIQS